MKRLNPSNCQVCGTHVSGNYGMTYMHGKWLCGRCQDKEKKRTVPKVAFTAIDELNAGHESKEA